MTRRTSLSQAAIDRAVKAAKAQGMAVTITATDGTSYSFTPALDQKAESPQPLPKQWRRG